MKRRGTLIVRWFGALTIVRGVLEGSDVQEGGAYPVQSHVDIPDGLENNLSIQVLHQVTV